MRFEHLKRQTSFVIVVSLCLALFGCAGNQSLPNAKDLVLASDGKALYSIVIPENPSQTEIFAAKELSKYLKKITGANFTVCDRDTKPSIVLSDKNSFENVSKEKLPSELGSDGYALMIRDKNIYLVGSDSRNVLYAVYDFLERLGCKWLSPGFAFYADQHEYVPTMKSITYRHQEDLFEKPSMKYRKLYIEEGHSHNLENLKQMVEWMSKVKFNILVCPIDYQGRGNIRWDNWRDELTPELRKRGILIEVGGHGYQNFINADMENGELFKKHPDWFALGEDRKRKKAHGWVICSSKKEPMDYMKQNVLKYLSQHSEIDIFDFWPPDGVKWCRCSDCESLGSPSDRHALIVSEVMDYLRKNQIDVRLECIAYTSYEQPPEKVKLDKSVMVDMCPFKQDFTKYIYDSSSEFNASFSKNVDGWLATFDGDICVYSYYRKYAWRCLPNIIAHYMQKELQFYNEIGIKGISTYSEPGDWFTYELNHYILSKLAWDVNEDVDSLIRNFCEIRYSENSELAVEIVKFLENTVRFYCRIPQTNDKQADEYIKVLVDIDEWINKVNSAKNNVQGQEHLLANLSRLQLMLEYMKKDVQLQHHRANGLPKSDRRQMVDKLMEFLDTNADKWVFLHRNHKRFQPKRMYKTYVASEAPDQRQE